MSTRFVVSAVVAAVATYFGGPTAGAQAFSLTPGFGGTLSPSPSALRRSKRRRRTPAAAPKAST